jgi:hypothetical protein
MISKTVLLLAVLLTACGTLIAQTSDERPGSSSLENGAPGTLAHNQTGAKRARAVSLCARDEETIWSCEIDGSSSRKIASICGSKQLDERRGYVQYRFGRPRNVELEYPQGRANTQSAFTYKRYTRPLVTNLAIKFTVGGYTYKIYDESNDEERPGRRAARISVLPPGEGSKPLDLNCRKPIAGTLMSLEDVVTRSASDDLTEP